MNVWDTAWWRLLCSVLNHAGLNSVLDAVCTAKGWDH